MSPLVLAGILKFQPNIHAGTDTYIFLSLLLCFSLPSVFLFLPRGSFKAATRKTQYRSRFLNIILHEEKQVLEKNVGFQGWSKESTS